MNAAINSSKTAEKNAEKNTRNNTEENRDKKIPQKKYLMNSLWPLIVGSGLLASLLMQWLLCPLRSEPVYQVDLQRIVKSPIAAQHIITQRLREAITAVAGRHLVLVKPAVIQGATDITDAVLMAMTLPLSSETKQLDKQEKRADTQPNTYSSSEIPKWLMP